jgi:hypothetical protein
VLVLTMAPFYCSLRFASLLFWWLALAHGLRRQAIDIGTDHSDSTRTHSGNTWHVGRGCRLLPHVSQTTWLARSSVNAGQNENRYQSHD